MTASPGFFVLNNGLTTGLVKPTTLSTKPACEGVSSYRSRKVWLGRIISACMAVSSRNEEKLTLKGILSIAFLIFLVL